jgi:hypothetical protein
MGSPLGSTLRFGSREEALGGHQERGSRTEPSKGEGPAEVKEQLAICTGGNSRSWVSCDILNQAQRKPRLPCTRPWVPAAFVTHWKLWVFHVGKLSSLPGERGEAGLGRRAMLEHGG